MRGVQAGEATVGGRTTDPAADSTTPVALTQASRSLLIGSLAYRIVATLAPVIVLAARHGVGRSAGVLALAAFLVTVNVVALTRVRRDPTVDLARIRSVIIVDVLVAFGVNLAASWLVPGPVSEQYHDVFWFYLVSCVVLVTGGWGAVAGLTAVVAAVPLQLVMDRLSEGHLADPSVTLGRMLWLSVGLVMAFVILALVGLSAKQAALHGIRAGQATERARILRSMHDTVLQTLEAMALDSSVDRTAPTVALAELRRAARAEAISLRTALDELIDAPRSRLCDVLAVVVGAAAGQGVRVDLSVAEMADGDLTRPRVEALRDSVREALRNTAKHSGSAGAVVRVEAVSDGVEVVVRDHGCGFAANESAYGFGIRESIRGRLLAVGGTASVESSPGRGTRVRMWVPAC